MEDLDVKEVLEVGNDVVTVCPLKNNPVKSGIIIACVITGVVVLVKVKPLKRIKGLFGKKNKNHLSETSTEETNVE